MNKYQEALNYLKGGNLFGELSNEALDSILELVDKETPMKPNRNDRYCGGCDVNRLIKGNDNYCSVCGKKIDWGGEN